MPEWRNIFEQHDGPGELGADFEERVFSKIKKKKKQKKIGFMAMAVIGAVVLLSLFQLFRPASRPALPAGASTVKEEIPLSEDLFFSASDSRTRYSIEPVSSQSNPKGQDAALNQI
jgi:hypothetical protein